MSKIIESIEYFPAGYCTSYAGLLFKGVKNRKMTFPAGVFLIKHRDKAICSMILAITMILRRNFVMLFTVWGRQFK